MTFSTEQMEILEEKWVELRLMEEEKVGIELDEDCSAKLVNKEQRSLLGKICLSRSISKEVVGSMMAKVWSISKAVNLTKVRPNFFAIIFENIDDKMRVWSGRPWSFDNNLLLLKEFKGYTSLHRVNFDFESFWMRIHNLPLSCMTKDRVEVEDVEV